MRLMSASIAVLGFVAQAIAMQVPLLSRPQPKSLSGRYLHITDIHIDM
jgi:hypothetical protein